MKKILAFLLCVVMVASVGTVSFSALDAEAAKVTQADATLDEVTPDEATKDEASKDEASKDEATFDEAYLRGLVLEYILSNVYVDIDLFADVDYSLDMIFTHNSEATSDYAVFDLNFSADSEYLGNHYVKIGDSVYSNQISYMVSGYIGIGYFVVFPETQQVLALEETAGENIENLKALFIEAGLGRLMGDADKDGKLTVRDATYIQKHAAGFEGFDVQTFYLNCCRGIADFNGDYKVNVKDATNIQKYIAGLPFTFCTNTCEVYAETPADAERLEYTAEVIDTYFYSEGYIRAHITNTQEYAEIFSKESEIYNQEFFEENDLVYANRIFGSGSVGYRVNGLYRLGDTLYLECNILEIPPGFAGTCDVKEKGAFVTVSKELTQGVNKLVVFENSI